MTKPSLSWRVISFVSRQGFLGFLGILVTGLGAVVGLEAIFSRYFQDVSTQASVWALTISGGVILLGVLGFHCARAHKDDRDEIERLNDQLRRFQQDAISSDSA